MSEFFPYKKIPGTEGPTWNPPVNPSETVKPFHIESTTPLPKPEDLAVVMAYEAMRICLGLPTKHYHAERVLEWMRVMAGCKKEEQ